MRKKSAINKLTIILGLCICWCSGHSQLYKTSFGLRFDDDQLGFSLTQKVAKPFTVEVFADADKTEFRYGGIIRHHSRIAGRRLNWYQGLGGHGGLIKNGNKFYGVNGVIGAEYKFFLFPIGISFDFNPLIHLSPGTDTLLDTQTVFSIKYIIVKDRKKNRMHRDQK